MPNPGTRENLEGAARFLYAGRLNEAENLCRGVLSVSPAEAEALKLLGLSMLRRGRSAEAVDFLRRAIVAAPDIVEYRSILGGILAGQGRFDEAIHVLEKAILIDPRGVAALYNLGCAFCARGSWDQAIEALERAIEVQPGCAEAHYKVGGALRAKGKIDGAIAAYRRAMAIRPDFYHASNELGMLLLGQEQHEQAAAAFRSALPCGQPEPHNNLGNALQGLRRFAQAVDAYGAAIKLRPDYAEAHCNLANALRELGRLEEAVAAANRALSLRPTISEAHVALGLIWIRSRQWSKAIEALNCAMQLNPGDCEIHYHLAGALAKVDQPDESVASYERALVLNPNFAAAQAEMGNALRDRAQLEEAIAAYRQAASLSNESWMGSAAVYALYFHPDYDARRIRDEAISWNNRYAASMTPASPIFPNARSADRRIKVGYVSPDFRAHAIGLFLLRLMASHNHGSCEVFLYSGVRNPDRITQRFRACADVWRETVGLDDQQLANLIRSDQIDVLVDVTMHLHDGRLLTFARKPAPVQITYLAHPGTTGLASMDYRLGDRYMDPPEDDCFHTEKTIRLSGSYFCYDPMEVDLAVNGLPAPRNGFVTFGSMNNFSKINCRVLECWAQVMRAAPRSRLLVLAPPGLARRRLVEQMESLQIASDRIEFEGHRPRQQYTELYHRIDVCLDTLPYNGHTTTLDALWMGVPVITLPGTTAVSRGGLSILTHLGMPELVARSPEQCVQIATDLAGDPYRLAHLRATLRARLEASPLMDGPAFARSVEAAYRFAWRQSCDAGG